MSYSFSVNPSYVHISSSSAAELGFAAAAGRQRVVVYRPRGRRRGRDAADKPAAGKTVSAARD